MSVIVCKPKSLTATQEVVAVRRAIEINPAMEATVRTITRTSAGRRGGPRRLALLIENRWPKAGVQLSVQFLDNESKELRKRILLHMNAWTKTANVVFRETSGAGLVRIARLNAPEDMAGYWSYVGTQILGIDDDQPTFNLEGFTMRTSESEFRRVVRHEAGHTLGFEHEHMRKELVQQIDKRKAIAYFDRTDGWSAKETLEQVLTPLAAKSIMGTTESDPHSIMCYQLPGAITKNGKDIPGGLDINANDFAFAAKVYPKTRLAPKPPRTPAHTDAGKSEDAPSPIEWASSSPREIASYRDADTLQIVIMDAFSPDQTAERRRNTDDTEALLGAPAAAKQPKGPKYARVFATYGGARVTCAMRLRADEGEDVTAYGRIIGMHKRIKSYTNREKGSLPSDEQMLKFGSDLFETLFQGDVRRLYDEARARQQSRKLDIVFTSMIPWIAEKPWEFAYDASRHSFLATEEIHLVRNVLTAVPANIIPIRHGPLRILVAAAQPVGFGHLSVAQEVEVIHRGFEPLIAAGSVTVEVLARATPSRVHECLLTGAFDVVHFIGHGTFDEATQEGALIFEDDRGGELRLGERSVREIFCQRGVSLVFLNSCQSGSGGLSDFNKGVAQALVSHGLPALVANQYSVLDSSATSFAQHLYWALARGMSIGEAAREARIAVNYSMQGELIDWAVPVVYARDPNLTLCARSETANARMPARVVRKTTRRLARVRAVRVVFCDIDGVFPSLASTLARMNEAQTVFGFELADGSMPLDVWDVEAQNPDGTPYLWAEKLAARMSRMALEVRADVLVFITRHWLRDNETLNLFGWWPDNRKPPVVIFSCAGFSFAAEGRETDRVIANGTVTALAGFLGDLGTHDTGARDCPLSYNEIRDPACLTSPQKFDKGCRATLKKKLAKELPALDSLLRLF